MNAEWLNPIVVKELRQGLKSRSFIGSFMALQGLMVLSMCIYFATIHKGTDLTFADGLFWFIVGLLLIVIMPLRGFQAIHEEQKNNTLEMVFLTQMSSWDIAFGKWLALIVQLLLLVCAVLPYMVLRYFIGAINIAEDLISLFSQILVAMLLVAAGVGFSGWKSKLLRGLIIAGAVMSLYMIPLGIFGISRSLGHVSFNEPYMWLFGISGAILMMLFFVEYGAYIIAPPAENHAWRKRTLALIIFGLFNGLALYSKQEELVFLGLIFLVPVCIDALCEPLYLIPSLYRVSGRVGPLRRFVYRFFYPGWPSGFLFVNAMMALTSVSIITLGPDFDDMALFLVSLIGTLFMPLAIILLFRRQKENLIQPYLMIQLIFFIISMVFVVASFSLDFDSNLLAGVLPISSLIMVIAEKSSDTMMVFSASVTGACLLVILIKMTDPWRRILEFEKSP